MFGLFLVTVMLLFYSSCSTVSQKDCTINHSKTNIVLVIADDLGWADIGFSHKPDGFVSDKGIPETPHLDRTAREGLVLDNLYTQAACTPTRGSLMTGKYAFRLGQLFASYVLTTADKKGPSDRFLSEELSGSGYKVHGVGKWHLGHQKGNLPTQKGFDSFYGLYSGMGSYYTHKGVGHSYKNGIWLHNQENHDFHYDYKNGSESVFTETNDDEGVHSTDLFTKAAVSIIKEHDKTSPLFLYAAYTAPHSPLQPDESIVAKRNHHILDVKRRRYAAMVTQMDDGFGEILSALKERSMKENTVIIFLSDHGAALVQSCWDYVGGSNKPYRDGKFTFFEGGIKSPAFIWAPWLNDGVKGTHSKALAHVVDIHSLVLSLAGMTEAISGMFKITEGEFKKDAGNSLLRSLHGDHSGRDTILHNLVVHKLPEDKHIKYCSPTTVQPDQYGVIRHHNYKLFYGDLQSWCHSDLLTDPCPDLVFVNGRAAMLFDLELDPYETVNVAASNIDVVEKLAAMILEYSKDAPSQWVV